MNLGVTTRADWRPRGSWKWFFCWEVWNQQKCGWFGCFTGMASKCFLATTRWGHDARAQLHGYETRGLKNWCSNRGLLLSLSLSLCLGAPDRQSYSALAGHGPTHQWTCQLWTRGGRSKGLLFWFQQVVSGNKHFPCCRPVLPRCRPGSYKML